MFALLLVSKPASELSNETLLKIVHSLFHMYSVDTLLNDFQHINADVLYTSDVRREKKKITALTEHFHWIGQGLNDLPKGTPIICTAKRKNDSPAH